MNDLQAAEARYMSSDIEWCRAIERRVGGDVSFRAARRAYLAFERARAQYGAALYQRMLDGFPGPNLAEFPAFDRED